MMIYVSSKLICLNSHRQANWWYMWRLMLNHEIQVQTLSKSIWFQKSNNSNLPNLNEKMIQTRMTRLPIHNEN